MRRLLQRTVGVLWVLSTIAMALVHGNQEMHSTRSLRDAYRQPPASDMRFSQSRWIEGSNAIQTTRRLQQSAPSSSESRASYDLQKQVSVVPQAGYNCTLKDKLKDRILDEESRTWRIDDEVLDIIKMNVQVIVNCTKKGDAVLFNVTKTVRPKKRIEISHKIVLSGWADDKLDGDTIPQAKRKMQITCSDNQGLFHIRSSGVLLANMIISRCHLIKENTEGIIEVEHHGADQAKGSVELRHVTFTGNQLDGAPALHAEGSSCSVKFNHVEFRNNSCRGVCFAHLSGSSELKGVSLTENRPIGDKSGKDDALIFMTAKSTSEVKSMESQNNEITALRLHDVSAVEVRNSEFISNSGSPTVHLNDGKIKMSNCSFAENSAPFGAAIYMRGATALLRDVACTGNKAAKEGGCLYSNNSVLNIHSGKITNNGGSDGGGVYSQFSNLRVFRSDISSNIASGSGAGVHAKGGVVKIDDTNFRHNKASKSGGGIFCEFTKNLTVINSTFGRNIAEVSGGAIWAKSSQNADTTLFDCYLWHNSANESAGAVQLTDIHAHLRDCSIQDNSANAGGAINLLNSHLRVETTSITANKASTGGGIYAKSLSKLIFIDSILDSNRAQKEGGGLYASYSNVTFLNSSVSSNHCEERGGGVLVEFGGEFNMTYSRVDGNVASNGGGGYVQGARVHLEETIFIRCHAQKRAGGLFLSQAQNATLVNTSFLSNDAFSGGGIFDLASPMTFTGGTIERNKVEMLGGGISCQERDRCVWELVNLDFRDNVARYGGAVFVQKESTVHIQNSRFFKNQARDNGGAVHTIKAKQLKITDCHFINNSAKEGGAVVTYTTRANITDCEFRGNSANATGAAISAWDNATVTLQRVTISASQARSGGAIHIHRAPLLAHKLTVRDNNVSEDGGILATGNSSVLCSECTFRNNIAKRGASVAIQVDQKLNASKFQFIDCHFQNNLARVGGMDTHVLGYWMLELCLGAVFFVSEDVGEDCASNDANCTLVFFTGCSFISNTATRAGGALFARFPLSFRYICKSVTRENALSFHNETTLERANAMISKNVKCPRFKHNNATDYGNFVGSYASKLVIKRGGEVIDLQGSVIPHRSGNVLPTLVLELRDQYLGFPVVNRTSSPVKATMKSTRRLITGALILPLEGGKVAFENVRATARPGSYKITISFDDDAVENVSFFVKIEECIIGEFSSEDCELCLNCTANQFNFYPKGKDCFACPSNGDCSTRVILPVEGYSNRHPCSQQIQSCLVKSACAFNERQTRMNDTTWNLTSCRNITEDRIAKFRNAQCKTVLDSANDHVVRVFQGSVGPFCGSCQPGYAQTPLSECRKCLSPGMSAMLLTLAAIFSLGLNAFAVRTSLPPRHSTEEARSRRSLQSVVARAPVSDVEMVRMLPRDDVVVQTDHPSPADNGPDDFEEREETAKTAVSEIFKIALNFVQVVGVAASINSNWTESIVSLFSFANFVGGVTADAAGFSSVCLAQEDAFVSRAAARSIVSLAIPLAVFVFFLFFWIRQKVMLSESWTYLWERSLMSLLSVAYLSYVSVTKIAVGVIYCVEVYDGVEYVSEEKQSYWAADTAVKCFEGQHAILAGSVGLPVLIVFSVGLPLILVITLLLHGQDRERRWFRNATGFLYGAYDDKYVFWESLVMLRKAALSAIVVFGYPLGSDVQGTLAVVVLTLSLFLHALCCPYRQEHRSLNGYELWSLATCLLTFAFGLLFDDDRLTLRVRVSLTVFLIFMVCGLLSFFLFKLFVTCAAYSRTVLEGEGIEGIRDWTHLRALKTYARMLAAERWSSVASHLSQSVPLNERIPLVRMLPNDSATQPADDLD